ncbi:hypothetical protein [Deinococcus hopiensis]|uniref:Uncharacterized protein n=1 Tax=Deinococcus hopiensis KR-140 TaxID=695939 RepID=A0A1W1VU53_9DEIO|nr:hypothetical protein [Deinococcus hopiensis]SMB96879.1 hypothetical protein SAMN00790413_06181 [Deinococcus hopiensis KR-140]
MTRAVTCLGRTGCANPLPADPPPPLPELVQAVQYLIVYRKGAPLHELDAALVLLK